MIAKIHLMVSRIGPKLSTSNGKGAIGPIRDTTRVNLLYRYFAEEIPSMAVSGAWPQHRSLFY